LIVMMTALCKKEVSSLLGSIEIVAEIANPTQRDDVNVVSNALAVELGD
jgi:hypothetical protein